MITYKVLWTELPHIKVPVLHTVMYAHSTDGVDAKYQRSLVDEWLKANCRAPYYHSIYHTEKFIQFEDDEDAMWFSLRWS